MFERLKRLYREGQIKEEALHNAVTKGWITEDQVKDILSTEQNGKISYDIKDEMR